MMCPKCMVQMHQKNERGGGRAEEDYYETWTIQECPACGANYKEFYSAKRIEAEDDY